MSTTSELQAVLTRARTSGDYNQLMDALPYAKFLGMRAELHDTTVRVCLPFQDMLVGNVRLPSLHGGVVGAVLESAALLQLIHLQGTLPLPKTIDFTVDYLRAARPETLYAEAEVQRAGRRVANVRMRAFQKDREQPIALGRGNFLLD